MAFRRSKLNSVACWSITKFSRRGKLASKIIFKIFDLLKTWINDFLDTTNASKPVINQGPYEMTNPWARSNKDPEPPLRLPNRPREVNKNLWNPIAKEKWAMIVKKDAKAPKNSGPEMLKRYFLLEGTSKNSSSRDAANETHSRISPSLRMNSLDRWFFEVP